eukprot:CAMPEP_0178958752 /NCGR_PEP_ID=MMETSP0789-20121207/11835_1 /TAXON_ID=3005 /ORGANISM="Rhizosolenia setigera, Strain CCMP 1694" /LENGTH=446 /DNA_ID=CAMNT_0020641529 /DNA_START=98 /DNA_END=1438 /DNA_ORIENTATION=-
MSGLLIAVMILTKLFSSSDDTSTSTEKKDSGEDKTTTVTPQMKKDFASFQRQYLLVYMIIMLADWMQGTHMYTLYLSYGVNISALFLTGFLSGAIFAPFLGSLVDKYGRKMSCIVYCVLEIVINCLEHSHNFHILLLGRVLGGISTNLLFSAFESWMTTEHNKRNFPEEWISKTFSSASIINGTMAVMAGIVAQLLEDQFGQIGPFQGAVGLTALALMFVLGWEENYGEEKDGDHESSGLYTQFVEGWKTTISDSNVWRIGMTQALSEGAMYTFVFMWVPTLLSLDPPGGLPTGCVFSSLMIAITIGGVLYPPLESFYGKFFGKEIKSELSASFIYLIAGCSMAIPASGDTSLNIVLFSFITVEMCVGLFMPVSGTLRSKYIPDSLHGSILNIFRLPLNIVVVLGTYATDHMERQDVFMLVSGCFLAAALLQATMCFGKKKNTKTD